MACYAKYDGTTLPGNLHVSESGRRVEYDQVMRPLLERVTLTLRGQYTCATRAAYVSTMETLQSVFSENHKDFKLYFPGGDATDLSFDAADYLAVLVTQRPRAPSTEGAELAVGGFRTWTAQLEFVRDLLTAGGVVEFEEDVDEPGAWPRYGAKTPFAGPAIVAQTSEASPNVLTLSGRVVGWAAWPDVPACPLEGVVPYRGPMVRRSGPRDRFREDASYHRRFEISYSYEIFATDAHALEPRAWPE